MIQRLSLFLIVFLGNFLSVLPVFAQLSLKSSYFSNDPIALSIIAGNQYQLRDSVYFTPEGKINSQSFEYKIINAFRQLGYSRLTFTNKATETASTVSLHKYQKKYLLPVTDYVEAQILFLIDEEMAQKEQNDNLLALAYQPFPKFMESPINEPDIKHLAALYYTYFSILPSNLNEPVWTIDDFRKSLVVGLGGNLGKMMNSEKTRVLSVAEMVEVMNSKGDFAFCPSAYYQVYKAGSCIDPALTHDFNPVGDIEYLSLLSHEYGHGVGKMSIVIDGSAKQADYYFGSISFNMEGLEEWENSSIKLRPFDPYEYISDYGDSSSKEDFAESFDAYISIGSIFRHRAHFNIFLQQKYDFIKNNIFYNIEFDTGSMSSYYLWNTIHNPNSIPNNPEAYMIEDPDWIWDYLYPLVSKQYKKGWNNILYSNFTESLLDSNCGQYSYKQDLWIGKKVDYGLAVAIFGNKNIRIMCN